MLQHGAMFANAKAYGSVCVLQLYPISRDHFCLSGHSACACIHVMYSRNSGVLAKPIVRRFELQLNYFRFPEQQ